MRVTRTLAVLGIAASAVTVLAVTPAVAQVPPSATLTPNTGTPGSGFKVQWRGFTFDPDCQNFTVSVFWDGKQLIGSGGTSRGSGSTGVSVPNDATAGGHRVTARATGCPGSNASNTFTVFLPPVTTTQPPPPTTTTTVPPVVTTQPPVVTTKRPTTTTTTTTTETTTTTTETPSSVPSSSTSSGSDGALTLDKDNIQPGDPLTATGTGCKPDSDVRLSSLNEDVGRARADSTGRFSTPVEFSVIQPGRHVIRAECGIILVGSVDVALTTNSAGGTTSTLVVLVFFLLIGATMLRRQFSALRLPKTS